MSDVLLGSIIYSWILRILIESEKEKKSNFLQEINNKYKNSQSF